VSTSEMDTSLRMASTGIAGLDDIMAGGFAHRRLYLVEGVPGSGKTTLALQYLIAGASRDESVLYVTSSAILLPRFSPGCSCSNRPTSSIRS
jgi:predicted ATP-dependent serine protease